MNTTTEHPADPKPQTAFEKLNALLEGGTKSCPQLVAAMALQKMQPPVQTVEGSPACLIDLLEKGGQAVSAFLDASAAQIAERAESIGPVLWVKLVREPLAEWDKDLLGAKYVATCLDVKRLPATDLAPAANAGGAQ